MRKLVLTICFFQILLGCATTKSRSSGAAQKGVPCFCGVIKSGQSNKTYCAIWPKKLRNDRPTKAFASRPSKDCSTDACEKMDSEVEACSRFTTYQMPEVVPLPEPCFCDFVPITGSPLGDEACAIWRPGDKDLLEYHFLDRCELDDCKKPPFAYAKSHCQNKFVPYYK
ncbi:MAG: hypothetical protein AB7T49_12695 [Oligoflexales bacterium]